MNQSLLVECRLFAQKKPLIGHWLLIFNSFIEWPGGVVDFPNSSHFYKRFGINVELKAIETVMCLTLAELIMWNNVFNKI